MKKLLEPSRFDVAVTFDDAFGREVSASAFAPPLHRAGGAALHRLTLQLSLSGCEPAAVARAGNAAAVAGRQPSRNEEM